MKREDENEQIRRFGEQHEPTYTAWLNERCIRGYQDPQWDTLTYVERLAWVLALAERFDGKIKARREVLDHGYVEIVETWGSDERIVEAARMSTGRGFLGWPGDEKLLRFLWDNKHHTPFEMAGATLEVQAPIFVFREWHRHRTQSYNELSARYTPLPDVNYVPSVERLLLANDGKNRQAGTIAGAGVLDARGAEAFREFLLRTYAAAEEGYQEALRAGVPKELARVHLPVGRYSRMRASANLRNWLGFMALRSTEKNPSAQWEIRQFADAGLTLLADRFPRTLALFQGR